MKRANGSTRVLEVASAVLKSAANRFVQAPAGSGEQRAALSQLLESAGDQLRFGGTDPSESLSGIGIGAIESWLSAMDGKALSTRWTRAAEEAVEAALGEDEEQSLWAEAAWEALAARDALASQWVALELWELHQPARLDVSSRLSRHCRELDSLLHHSVRAFTSLNASRREWRDALLPQHRENAWWFGARAECDGLLLQLAGVEDADRRHTGGCPECTADLARTRIVERPPQRHLDAQLLWALDARELSPVEAQRWRDHARDCAECAAALNALETELPAEEEEETPALPRLRILPGGSGRKVLVEREDVVVSVVRSGDVTRLQISPRKTALRIAASLVLEGVPRRSAPDAEGWGFVLPRQGEGTLELKLGSRVERWPISIE